MHFNEDRNNINADILAMASRAEEDLHKAVKALRDRDADLARWVKDDDATINSMQLQIQDLAAVLIATQQPVAKDLRELVSAIRLADRLERIGDYAVHLAKAVLKLKSASWPQQYEMLGEMGETGCLMIRSMIDSYIRQDVEAATVCAQMDTRVDELHRKIISLTLESLKSDPSLVDEGTFLIRTSAFLERLADQVTNACELVAYMVSGEHVELN
jgi:phosphate transport system protein